jgi:hypothetical protein
VSLDVTLRIPGSRRVPQERIFIRDDGGTREVSRAEWDEMHPGREPVSVWDDGEGSTIYSANITHNLGRMASAVDLYKPLWRPEEIGITHARDLIEPLRTGLARLGEERDDLQQYNPPNGWGD